MKRVSVLEFEDYLFDVPTKKSVRVNGVVRTGEWAIVRGPSGCGKTTFLKSIAGLWPASGELKFDGMSLFQKLPKDRGVGMVFQGAPLFQEYNVYENIVLPLKVSPRARDLLREEKIALVKDVLLKMGISHLQERLPWQLSGGERGRVAVAQALILKPRILLLDEAFVSLDKEAKVDILNWLKDLVSQEGLMVFLVTHSDDEARILDKKESVWNLESSELHLS